MARRLWRSILCLFGVILAYWCYAMVMVPLLEPTVTKVRPRDFLANPLDHTSHSREFERLFADDAWERKNAKVFEIKHGALIFGDYFPQEDGTLELKPVTLVYYTSQGADRAGTLPILVQAPEGAVVESDRPIRLSRGDFGKPIGAQLRGQIIIRRPASSPEHDDELFVTTRNVKIDRQRIWTPNDVEFRFGPHWGRGRDLQITFQSSDPLGSRDSPKKGNSGEVAAGVQLLELLQIDKVLISLEDQTLTGRQPAPLANGTRPDADGPSRQVPVEVRCRGAFRFDFQQSLATLVDDVRLVQRYPDGITDSVKCDLLEMHFTSSEQAVATSSSETSESFPIPEGRKSKSDESADSLVPSPSGFSISRVVAQGSPVTLDAPSRNMFAQAEEVQIYLPEQRLVLEGPQGARIRFGQRELRAPRIDYTFHPEDTQRVGRLEALGPGRFTGVVSDSDPRRFSAAWQDVLRLRRLEDQPVLSLHGQPLLDLQGMGTLSAEQLHLFLLETSLAEDSNEASAAIAPSITRELPSDKPSAGHSAVTDQLGAGLSPDRLVALRDVRLQSAELTGHAARELKVWFVHREPAEWAEPPGHPPLGNMAPADAPARTTVPRSAVAPVYHQDASGRARASSKSTWNVADTHRSDLPPLASREESESSGPPLHFSGRRVEARVVLGDDPQLTDLTVAGDVEITRPSVNEQGEPLRIVGDLLQISEMGEGEAHIEVRGKPAEAGAEGLVLLGNQIFCRQSTNQLWIPGPGQMRTPSSVSSSVSVPAMAQPAGSSPTTRPTAAPPMTIYWKGRMQFDGRLASFLQDVQVRGEQEMKDGELARFAVRGVELQVELTHQINFSQPGETTEQELGIRLLRFPGRVELENQSTLPDGQASSWEQMEVTHLRIDPIRGLMEADGPGWLSSVRRSTSTSPTPGFPPAAPQRGSGLVHIRVGFQRAVVGNMAAREVEFFEHVLTTYGPVDDWHQRIDPVRASLGQGGIEMKSDRLGLTEMRSFNLPARSHFEIQAVGNVEVRGESFQASGYRLSYDESKDLMILQWNGREYALVKTSESNEVAEVKELRVWPKTKKIQSDVRSIDLGPVGPRPR